MPRPRKWKRVCNLPNMTEYGPYVANKGQLDIIVMSVEEYETIRLIDLENLDQEECATRMQIARTTAQKIYNDARRKIADSFVNNKVIHIEGGDYRLCEESDVPCGFGQCRGMRHKQNGHGQIKENL
ncbi:MAG: DUF134 domain-containing protein [Erysipelotrichaceae bacterium]